MKTYGRRKADERDDVIVNLDELCRLCLAREEQLVPIFNDDEPIPLPIRIMACVALEVLEDDGLPSMICHPCHYQLEKYYVFRKKCESSDIKLRSHLRQLAGSAKEDEETESTSASDHQFITSSITLLLPEKGEEVIEECDVEVEDGGSHEKEREEEGNISLPQEQSINPRNSCTLKREMSEDHDMSEPEQEDSNEEPMGVEAVAAAVRASLVGESADDSEGTMAVRLLPEQGSRTHVQVTTGDGSVLLLELTTEEENAAESQFDENGEMKVLQCPSCPKAFARKAQLRRHSSVHTAQRGMTCGECEKWFPSRSALTRHERIHTGEKPFQCGVCNRSFAQKEILYRHFLVHSNNKPYECSVCGKGFTQREAYRAHQSSHVQPRPALRLHRCNLCTKIFCHASGLSRHLLTHTGRSYKCRDCDKSFNDKSSLRRHHRLSGHQST